MNAPTSRAQLLPTPAAADRYSTHEVKQPGEPRHRLQRLRR